MKIFSLFIIHSFDYDEVGSFFFQRYIEIYWTCFTALSTFIGKKNCKEIGKTCNLPFVSNVHNDLLDSCPEDQSCHNPWVPFFKEPNSIETPRKYEDKIQIETIPMSSIHWMRFIVSFNSLNYKIEFNLNIEYWIWSTELEASQQGND